MLLPFFATYIYFNKLDWNLFYKIISMFTTKDDTVWVFDLDVIYYIHLIDSNDKVFVKVEFKLSLDDLDNFEVIKECFFELYYSWKSYLDKKSLDCRSIDEKGALIYISQESVEEINRKEIISIHKMKVSEIKVTLAYLKQKMENRTL
jgi:hypothetical protein